MGNKSCAPSSSQKNLTEADIDLLSQKTNFTKEEIIVFHEKFISNFPKGELNKKQFVDFFTQLRPDRNAELFCSQLFNAFDMDKSGRVDFDEFLLAISFARDSDEKNKLRLAFRMYDLDNDGKLSKKEIEKIIIGIYTFNGLKLNSLESGSQQMAQKLLKKYDLDSNDYVTEEEFLNGLGDLTIRAFDSFSVLRNGNL